MTLARALWVVAALALSILLGSSLNSRPRFVDTPRVTQEQALHSGEPASQAHHDPECRIADLAQQPQSTTPSGETAQFPVLDEGTMPPECSPTHCGEILRAYQEDLRLVNPWPNVKKLDWFPISHNFVLTPLPGVVEVLQELTQRNVLLDRTHCVQPESLTLTWDVQDVPLEEFLNRVTEHLGIDWRIDEGVIVLFAPTGERMPGQAESTEALEAAERLVRQDELFSRTVIINGVDLPPRTVAELLASNLGVAWNTEDLDWHDPPLLSFDTAEFRAHEVVDILQKRAGVTTIFRDGMLWFATR